nr:hypothetical protein M513_09137 [Ipomoea batatas]
MECSSFLTNKGCSAFQFFTCSLDSKGMFFLSKTITRINPIEVKNFNPHSELGATCGGGVERWFGSVGVFYRRLNLGASLGDKTGYINNIMPITMKPQGSILDSGFGLQIHENPMEISHNTEGERKRTYRGGGDCGTTAEGLEAGVNDLPTLIIDLNLKLHHVAAGRGADQPSADGGVVLVEGADIAGVVVVVHHPLVVEPRQPRRGPLRRRNSRRQP